MADENLHQFEDGVCIYCGSETTGGRICTVPYALWRDDRRIELTRQIVESNLEPDLKRVILTLLFEVIDIDGTGLSNEKTNDI